MSIKTGYSKEIKRLSLIFWGKEMTRWRFLSSQRALTRSNGKNREISGCLLGLNRAQVFLLRDMDVQNCVATCRPKQPERFIGRIRLTDMAVTVCERFFYSP
jgi:hypothetical protein